MRKLKIAYFSGRVFSDVDLSFSESATKRQLNSQLYLCEKYNISKRFFCRHEIILIIIQQLICFLRTGNCSLSLYQSKRLQMLKEV